MFNLKPSQEKETQVLSTDIILKEVKRLAAELNVGKPMGPNWVAKFLKQNNLSFKEQPKMKLTDRLKELLLEWYHHQQDEGLVTSKKMMEAARQIAKQLQLETNITKGWIESFRRNKNIRLEDQGWSPDFMILKFFYVTKAVLLNVRKHFC